MNRRKFFGMSVAALTAAGLPLALLPERTMFMPPRFGWRPAELGDGFMREVSYVDIAHLGNVHRFDAVGRDIWSNEHQFHVEVGARMSECAYKWARGLIGNRFQHDGLIALPAKDHLVLPRGTVHLARYV